MNALISALLAILAALSGAVGIDLDRDPRPTSLRTALVALAFLAGIVVAAFAATYVIWRLLG